MDLNTNKNIEETTIDKKKLAQNVIKLKNKKEKDIFKKKKQKEKIVKKCNKKIISTADKYRDIYMQIDKFNNNGKKTIAYFVDSFYPNVDGVVMVMENYVKYMSKYFNVVVCAPRHSKNDIYYKDYFVLYSDSIPVKKQGYDLAFPQFDNKFQKFISLLKIDLIHVHSPFNMGTFGVNLAKKRKIPCFSTFHSQFKRDFYENVKSDMVATVLTKIILYVYKKSTLTLTMNEFSRKLIKEYGLKKKVEIIPNATNMKKKNFDVEFENSVLEKYKINNKRFNIVFIGRLVAVKNVYFIINVLKELCLINNNFNFIFVGDGPEKYKMQKLCEENNMEKYINFVGKILNEDEKSIIIKNSQLLFFPSEYDTDGIVKMECACYDIPALCLKETGAASSIRDNQNGFLEDKDELKCAKRLDFLINNVDFVKKIGKNANLEIYKTWDIVCSDLKNLYDFYLRKNTFKNQSNKSKNI